MLRKAAAGLVMVLGLLLFSVPVWALNFEPGMYEITSTVEMPGMPAGMLPTQTSAQCMTEQDPVPRKDSGEQDCEITDMKKSKNTVTWKMTCNQQGQKMTSHGQMKYSGDSFTGTFISNIESRGGNMTITTRVSGQRIGDCK